MDRKKTCNLLATGVMAAAASQIFSFNVWAQSDAKQIADLERKLAVSTQQMQALAARLEKLEQQLKAPAGGGVPVADAGRIDVLERSVAEMADAAARPPTNAGVPLHGFADVGYAHSSQDVADHRKRGFVLGNVDFYLTPEFGDHVKSLIELNFEYSDAGVLNTDLERMQIGYTVNDALTLWGGRFHTPYGYWNTAYHHGAQIQTSVLRPKMVAFEDQGGVLPAHTVGVWATGQTHLGAGKLEYDLYVGNGDRILDRVLDFNAVRDDNGNRMLGASLRYRFAGAADGLLVGVHGFSQKVNAYSGDVLISTSKLGMLGAYAFYDGHDWEIISEYYHFNNRNQSGIADGHASWAGFAQVGKTFGGRATPYLRVEKAALDQRDHYFANLDNGRSYQRQAAGVRYDLNPKAALKVEFNHTDEGKDGGQKYNEAQLQYAVRF